jgi:putative membrane protein
MSYALEFKGRAQSFGHVCRTGGFDRALPSTKLQIQLLGNLTMKNAIIVFATGLLFAAAGAAAQAPDDAQIASIVVTANQVDIDAGKLAESASGNSDVKAFARLMVTDHTGVNKSAVDLVTKLKVTPQDNPTSQSLKSGGEQNIAHLKTLKGAAFDKAYIDHEVVYHQQVIDAIDKTLIPNAKNDELKALLIKVKPAFVAHLEHAKQLQTSMGKKA